MSEESNQIIEERRQKLKALREKGVAFPNDFNRQHEAGPLHAQFGQSSAEQLAEPRQQVAMAGRMVLKRVMGKASFATLQDGTGRMQIYAQRDEVGEEIYQDFKHWDLGDIMAVEGYLFITKTGELTIHATAIRLLTKALRPLPEKFHGLNDQEQKYRQRYLDLITNEHSRHVFVTRSRIIQKIREFLVNRHYLEVETPMMHPIPGGAAAKPFVTHHNALDMPLYLRIAPELYLKRLVVGGMERVFEINRNFRNEGISTRHNPEFTMIEFYEAYRDYRYLMTLTEEMFRFVAESVLGTTLITYDEKTIDLAQPFHRLTIIEAIQKYHPHYSDQQLKDKTFLTEEVKRLGGHIRPNEGLGGLQLLLFEETTESLLFEPTFIIDYPAEVSPLARRSDQFPEITERFELFITGREIANGFSELNDPEDQAQRFLDQVKQKEAGDQEAMHYDGDYIRALEHGLPPTAGEGIGIDRLVMLLTNSPTIRDVLLFPQMRPE
ncbi:MAG: lysine--tRNA ligase [Ferrovum sp. 37-45-19]|uniref:lysine--tRNA ligase n=1 Tax=Ferrovum sp. JA12 TaxID=1356299 RepID=UPI000702C8D6|nr:lysine--tRNA ligase [Ferrovum sp. JA12]OYV79826.1 MAG: lysine--tRNA ligase [Ferrovum sp. 21-44-67]OYV95450.1 MAG: lysine--tRNA ligase [Ferrovum sp. 37-45-19]HQT81244.1 lysine--tRNA ligase [Ferrovaceae bacterium]KRH78131.1 lysine--tRNA ligase [Ferrovum sp. JA12]HQU05697.1 lysine--tRNA ligase [Ferrovaceae bacterium]